MFYIEQGIVVSFRLVYKTYGKDPIVVSCHNTFEEAYKEKLRLEKMSNV